MHAFKDSMWQRILKIFAKFWEVNKTLVHPKILKKIKILYHIKFYGIYIKY